MTSVVVGVRVGYTVPTSRITDFHLLANSPLNVESRAGGGERGRVGSDREEGRNLIFLEYPLWSGTVHDTFKCIIKRDDFLPASLVLEVTL